MKSRTGIFCSIVAAASVAFAAPSKSSDQALFASQFPARALAAHNAARAQAGAQVLAWDPQLAESAGQWAAIMAASGNFDHSDRKARPGVGENLWMGSHNGYSVEAMVGGWTDERRHFRPGVFPDNSNSGNWLDVAHYTQMIWPTTTAVGCALASNGRTDYLVCRYSPKGNVDGRAVGYGRGERG